MPYEYLAEVVSVYDGDTITVSISLGFDLYLTRTIRLNGINTPEIRTKNLEEKELGLLARDYLNQRILNKTVTLKTYKPDKYGRCLAEVYLGEIHINKELIDNGFALPYFGGKR